MSDKEDIARTVKSKLSAMSDQEEKEAKLEKQANKLLDLIIAELEEQITFLGKHGSDASRDRLIALAEKHVSEKYQHEAEKAEAEGDEREALNCDIMQQFVSIAVEKLRAKR
jgi:hypothetical protein